MIRFFNINDPYRLLVVLAFMIVMGIIAHSSLPGATSAETKGMVIGEMMSDNLSLYDEIWDSTPPLTATAHWLVTEVFDRSLGIRRGISVVLLFIQAAMLGFLLSNNRAFEQPGFLSSFIFAVLVFFSFDSITFTREIWASFFLLLAINRVLKQIQFRDQDESNLTLLGVFVGVSSLFVFTYSVFYFAILVILVVNSRPEPRQFLLFTLSFLFPHIILLTVYFLKGDLTFLWSSFYLPNFEFNTRSTMASSGLLLLSAVPLTYMLFALVMALRNARMTKYQSQIFQIMVFWLIFGLIEVWIARQRTAQSLIVCAAPLAYLINFYLIRIRRQRIANLMLLLFAAAVITIGSWSNSGKISLIDYSKNYPENTRPEWSNKKILVLTDAPFYFTQNTAGGFFPEWDLCADLFRQPGYYENVEVLNRAFLKNPPELIIDPENLMAGVFHYLPDLEIQYRRNGENYLLLKD